MTKQERDELNRLRAENEALKAKQAKTRPFSMKVSSKGGVSVYGLGRFPVTLYQSQWETLLSHAGDIKGFIEANKSSLKTKDDAVTMSAAAA